MGITLQNDFLSHFDLSRTRWEILAPGRAAVLRLRGCEGRLDIFAMYFPTGTQILDGDASLTTCLGSFSRSPAGLRAALRLRVGRAILPPDVTLTLVAGDAAGIQLRRPTGDGLSLDRRSSLSFFNPR